ncbi:MAG TPA: hypothetical protein VFJ58_27915 [Armatimonadota bacterium]|nr:hypothetical protein [Armatimonadota bacterium]
MDSKRLADRANRAAVRMQGLPERLRSGELSLARALDLSAALAGLRIAAGLPPRLTLVDLSFYGLEMADVYRQTLPPQRPADWVNCLALGRRLIWQLLAAGEARAARMVSSSALTAAGHEFDRIQAALSTEEFHLSSALEALAEFAYVGGPRSLFDRLGGETVYDRIQGAGPPVYTFRGSLASRPSYQRLPTPGPGELERFRKHVLDELGSHTTAAQTPGADPRHAAPFDLSGLIVLGCRANLKVREDLIPADSRPYLALVAHLLV